jgi:outer membrane protein assembly factor BamB
VTGLPRETKTKPDLRNELTPNADEDFYYVPSAAEAMAIDRKSREIVWRVPVDEPWAPPVPGEDRVFVPAGGIGLLAVEKATGEILWNSKESLRDTPVEIYSSRRRPIVCENAVYANVGEYHVSFSKDGGVNWTTDLGDGIHSGPVSFGDANYVSGEHLYEIDKRTGKKRVIIQGLDTPLTPTVSNECLFVSGRKTLYKYAL